MSKKHVAETPVHLAHQSSGSRTGTIDMKNKKPYRTASQKEQARASAVKCSDGVYRSTAPVSYHSK